MHGAPQPPSCLALLQEYADRRSEPAFEEIVRRYVDFVHSIALRRVGGNTHEAQDVCQRVFIDLAQQAARGGGPLASGSPSLGGWLHHHTCYVTANLRRSDERRRQRELEGGAMTANPASGEGLSGQDSWSQLSPELDDAVRQLQATDRESLILRFYEQRDLRSMGAALGISDDAAQKRVHRALERLREQLVRQGVTVSLASLGVLLTDRTTSAMPLLAGAAVTRRVMDAARRIPPAKSVTALATSASLLTWLSGKTSLAIVGGLALAALVWTLVRPQAEKSQDDPAEAARLASNPALNAEPEPDRPAFTRSFPAPSASATTAPANPERGSLQVVLHFVEADSDTPVPRVPVEYRGWNGARTQKETYVGQADGSCIVPVDPATTRLDLTTRLVGYADTRLAWNFENGMALPTDMTVPLERAVPIGGTVVSPDGQPVYGAKVGFNHDDTDPGRNGVVSQRFTWIETETDVMGRWSIRHIGRAILSSIYGGARHPDYVPSPMVTVRDEREAVWALTNGTYVFHLGAAGLVTGRVIDPQSQPVIGAKVSVGRFGEVGRREETTGVDGTFAVRGGPPGATLVTVVAEGFAPRTLSFDPESGRNPIEIQLQPGRTLRLRVVDPQGGPIPGANVWLDTMDNSRPDRPASDEPRVQADFSPLTDAEGRAVWEQAPDQELTFDVFHKGFMRLIQAKVRPDDREHVLTLVPALVLRGTVRDQETGDLIPRFHITAGGTTGEPDRIFWGPQAEHHAQFEGGTFRQVFEEPVLWGIDHPGFALKIEADNYASHVTRVFQPDEGEVELDIRLRRAATVTVKVVLPDGQPAPDAEVGLLSTDRRYVLGPHGFERELESRILSTDRDGLFPLNHDDAVLKVVVVHPAGFAQASPEHLRADLVLRLNPWSALDGTAWSRGELVAGRTYELASPDPQSNLTLSYRNYEATTDEAGRFRFDRVPPGTWSLRHRMPNPSMPGRNATMSVPVMAVEIPPGETKHVEIGKDARPVSLRPAISLSPGEVIRFAALLTPRPLPPPGIHTNLALRQEWMSRPDVQLAMRTGRSYQMNQASDGSWTADDVPPGTYQVQMGAMSGEPSPTDPRPGRFFSGTVTVPADGRAQEVVDLGEVALVDVK